MVLVFLMVFFVLGPSSGCWRVWIGARKSKTSDTSVWWHGKGKRQAIGYSINILACKFILFIYTLCTPDNLGQSKLSWYIHHINRSFNLSILRGCQLNGL
ncbi:hypothetical protein CLU79DRAFT_545662 [Phycomyces nitens]|nr:hypothetical protein CLU79DRAFT_545662 [Phycomyces nitens]